VLGPRWSAGAYFNFTTDLSSKPQINNTTPITYSDETMISAGIPIRYHWTPVSFLEFGGRFVTRAPHLSVPDSQFQWHQTEIWAYAAVSTLAPFPLNAPRAFRDTAARR
jgi:hypothetical protein